MLKPKQVDLSMLFSKPIAGGHPTNPTPAFLSGEKKQAVRTSTFIPPVETIERVSEEVNQVQLRSYLYVTSHLSSIIKLTPSRSKFSIGLSQDLDDSAVSLLVENGLRNSFPTVCDTWKAQNIKNKEITQKSISEKRRDVDEQLRNDQPLLEDALARGVTRRILDTYPYVLLFGSHQYEQDVNVLIVSLTQRKFSLRQRAQTQRILLQVEVFYPPLPKSDGLLQILPAL